ncbi:MAG: citryl-CoA lyase [Candidatus Diapherotrites archaeon]|uniref:Citryl-CoA lyase n=2 Tax=Candidatus Iainarchaeum sp. TaxID=3101447 RepID=A0A8T4L7N1_9ARCH|nr:citryl-CoA lyase [Candidatus Diapherotrites archaeon]
MEAGEKKWKTAITGHVNGEPYVRGYNLLEMVEKLRFTKAIYLVLKGELPKENEEKMLNAMLVSCIDHGLGPPSVTAARVVLSGGNPLNAGVAAGVLTLGDSHGGAIENCAKALQTAVKKGKPVTDLSREIVEKARFSRERIPGFGHRIYITDPRTEILLKKAKELGYYGKHTELAVQIEKDLEKALGKKQCLNVDGCIAAIISEMGFDYRLGKGFFIIGRVPGLVAHAFEEMTREKPFRRLEEEEMAYDGPAPRKLP